MKTGISERLSEEVWQGVWEDKPRDGAPRWRWMVDEREQGKGDLKKGFLTQTLLDPW